tara:strand:- start:1240 stop:1650 length:411 start_codon:yes stop_codon:yes gene_type:complete
MDVPNNVLNPRLYRKARKTADEKYKRNSAYKSMFIVSEYKRLGGKYSGKKKITGVKRWNMEEWIQVVPFLEEGKKVACGFGSENKACRPSKRIDENTPMTIEALVKKHGKKKILELAKIKKQNMSRKVNWEEARVI